MIYLLKSHGQAEPMGRSSSGVTRVVCRRCGHGRPGRSLSDESRSEWRWPANYLSGRATPSKKCRRGLAREKQVDAYLRRGDVRTHAHEDVSLSRRREGDGSRGTATRPPIAVLRLHWRGLLHGSGPHEFRRQSLILGAQILFGLGGHQHGEGLLWPLIMFTRLGARQPAWVAWCG